MTTTPGPTPLSALPASALDRRLALGVIIVSLAVFAALAPFATAPLARVDAFIPIYQTALIVNDLITMALLFGQYRIARARRKPASISLSPSLPTRRSCTRFSSPRSSAACCAHGAGSRFVRRLLPAGRCAVSCK